ncbi:MAG: FAA hydrolase family protein [Deltaproteobacteria bacterium]|nr:MAG: FAA hydrolase family protein [Deltaproteobacteria bacterium]
MGRARAAVYNARVRLPLYRDGSSGPTDFDLAPSKIVGVGVNYRAHAREMGKQPPDEPLIFLKAPSAVVGSGDPIALPAGFERIDYEAELGVVISRRARRVPADCAADFILGYTCVNDVTVRDLQRRDGQWTRAKGFDTFCPIGPCIRGGLDPANLRVRSRVNGELRQDSTTADLLFPVAQLIEFITAVMTLEPGDVITTGTPSGVGPLAAGDVVEVDIDGIGVLRNPVVAAPA